MLLALTVLPALAFPMPAAADGIIIPDPPFCPPGPCAPFPIAQLAIQYHHVQVTIQDQVAVTRVDQVFRNDNDWTVEGTYIFPLPPDSAVTSFTLWMNGEPVEGRVLSAEEARATYEEIVRTMRDPALLEYVDRGAVQASIFPIPAGGESRIQLEYTQVLTAENGLIHYRYPLNTERFSTEPLEDVSVSVEVHSADPIRAVYSPSHEISVSRDGDYDFTAGYEESNVTPNTDFDLYFSVASSEIGLNLITFRDPESDDPDGFFLLLAAPSVDVDPEHRIAKDVMIVLDHSGSMEGEKLRQALEALRYILRHLHPEDRFNIIAFSTSLETYASSLRPASEAAEAERWVDGISAGGSTDINRALLEAVAQLGTARPSDLIFLTDGLPTEGVTDTQSILENLQEEAPSSVRLFAFGVGYDVDTFLLDSLAQAHHGTTTYVSPDQAIDESVSAFFSRISTPVLTDLELDFGDITPYDLYPDPLPDLFAGSQLVLVGRYHEGGGGTITLSGMVEGERQTFVYQDHSFRASGGPDFLPRLWATRKIGHLLDQIRLEGAEQELIEQVVRLSIRYGIVTPYTSYLVTEEPVIGASAQDGIIAQEYQRMLQTPLPVSGQQAFERAAMGGGLGGADVAAAPPAEAAEVVRLAGERTFRFVDGVWIDTAFDPATMTTVRVPFLSEDYFDLAAARPEIGAAFAIGERVIALADGVAYEVVEADAPGDAIIIPPTRTPVPDEPAPGSGASTLVPQEHTGSNPGQDSSQDQNQSLPCLGSTLLLGLAVLPLSMRRRSR
jgi:Ca-activated chloride channel family protein